MTMRLCDQSNERKDPEQTAGSRGSAPTGDYTRPPGKRRNPDFEQVTAYIRKETHHQVKLALLWELKDRQFSDLVEELLSTWLKDRR